MFPVLFAIARTAGWMAQWPELVLDEEQKITRPKQIYIGYDERSYVPLDQRRDGGGAGARGIRAALRAGGREPHRGARRGSAQDRVSRTWP